MRHCCENCGWLDVNPGGALFCGYTDERTWKDECCMAWKDKEIPQTNADKIRQMSDEELEELLNSIQGDAYLVGFNARAESRYTPYGKSWLEWLKQEVRDGKD